MRRVFGWILGIAVLVLGWCIPTFTASAAESSDIEISSLSPEVWTGGSDLTISVKSSLPVAPGWDVEVFLYDSSLTDDEHAQRYVAGETFPGWRVLAGSLSREQITTSDSTSSVHVTIPADIMADVIPDGSGLRGLSVELTGPDGASWVARSLVVYNLQEVPSTQINVVALDPEDSQEWSALPGVSVASPTPTGTDLPLPMENADLSLLAATGSKDLLDLALSTRSPSDIPVVFASEAGFSIDAISALPEQVWVAPPSWSAPQSLVTPTSRTEVDGVSLLDQWDPGAELLNMPEGSDSEELQIRQRLRASALWVGLEDPEDQRTLFMVVNKPDTGTALHRVRALLDGSWITPVSFQAVLDSPLSIVERGILPSIGDDALAAAHILSPLSEHYSQARSVAEATPLGVSALDAYLPKVLAPTAYDLSLGDREKLVSAALRELHAFVDIIDVVPLGTVNVVNSSANFPVSVMNKGDTEISLRVALRPSDPRLQSKKPAYIQVPAREQVEVQIPITAVGYGDVEVAVEVATAAGVVLDDSEVVSVRVRADWEDTWTIIALSVFGALFVFGLARTIIKRRKPVGDNQ
ncbi:hypothetical protein FYJ24_11495 [Actinomycetaceae bacterium WB03_NA08]|uniref:Uncharacterized protein n=1 Tax=Scrofimicrobium canadense TaxID=2652290 RepID=A0A6N7WAA2_9ACTO|nr:DUF6049 family protein [Scrofimicrobium canadense]MSS85362.1 hypothetical protein [Scrofimicrobium canadense]